MRVSRRRGERGATLVEAAIIVPLIVLLTFGTIEFGFAFNEQGTTRSATRSAARAAATQSKLPPPASLEQAAIDALDAVGPNLATGAPDFALVYHHAGTDITSKASCLATVNCRVYDWHAASQHFVLSSPPGDAWQPSERGACAGRTERVGVFMRVEHKYLTGLPFSGSGSVMLTSNTVMALEPYPGATCEDNTAP